MRGRGEEGGGAKVAKCEKGRGREKKQPWGKYAERKALLEHSVVALPCFIVKQ